jgi:hypothetical protein
MPPTPATTPYLLPCPCGQKIPVEPRQAGGTVRCVCGEVRDVPRMLEMARLERAEPEGLPPARRWSWGVPHRLMLLGAVILVAGLVAVAAAYRSRPTPPGEGVTPEGIRANVQALSPAQALHFWNQLRRGGLNLGPTEKNYFRDMARYHAWMGVAVVLSGLGVAVMGVGIWMKMRMKNRG